MVDNLFDNIDERKEIMDIVLFIGDFCLMMQQYMAILKVLEGLKRQLANNQFIIETKRTVEQQLLLEFVKVFDKATFQKEENCSVLLLRDKVQKIKKITYKAEILNRLQTLQDEFNEIVSQGNWRNKKMAHHDMSTLNKWKIDEVDFRDVESLVFKLESILDLIFKSVCWVPWRPSNQATLMEKYKNSLSELCDILTTCKEQGALS